MPKSKLKKLRELLPRAEAHAAQIMESAAEAVQTVEEIKAAIAEEEDRPQRRYLRGLVTIPPIGAAATPAATHWVLDHSRAIASGAAVITAATTIGLLPFVDDSDPSAALAVRPAAPAVPGDRAGPRTVPGRAARSQSHTSLATIARTDRPGKQSTPNDSDPPLLTAVPALPKLRVRPVPHPTPLRKPSPSSRVPATTVRPLLDLTIGAG